MLHGYEKIDDFVEEEKMETLLEKPKESHENLELKKMDTFSESISKVPRILTEDRFDKLLKNMNLDVIREVNSPKSNLSRQENHFD